MIKKIKKIKFFPGFIVSNFVSKKTCDGLIKELNDFNNFDDFVMSGRNRINKGSKNFIKFTSSSFYSRQIFNKFNKKNFFNKINQILNKIDDDKFEHNIKSFTYSKKNFGLQKGKKLVNRNNNIKKNVLNLDMDFSVSEKGYERKAHRDRETRILNFLIYLNSIPKSDGGSLTLYKPKKNYNNFSRFPKRSNLIKVGLFKPTAGSIIFFKSTPQSYHSVDKFKAITKKKRFFIYGSFSLNKKVNWSKK